MLCNAILCSCSPGRRMPTASPADASGSAMRSRHAASVHASRVSIRPSSEQAGETLSAASAALSRHVTCSAAFAPAACQSDAKRNQSPCSVSRRHIVLLTGLRLLLLRWVGLEDVPVLSLGPASRQHSYVHHHHLTPTSNTLSPSTISRPRLLHSGIISPLDLGGRELAPSPSVPPPNPLTSASPIRPPWRPAYP